MPRRRKCTVLRSPQWNENITPYRKPSKLVEVLDELYSMEPKLRESEMREHMRQMKDDNGGLLFCYLKKSTTGMLLSEDQIQSWIKVAERRRKSQKECERRRIWWKMR
jgi:hypothetical protein